MTAAAPAELHLDSPAASRLRRPLPQVGTVIGLVCAALVVLLVGAGPFIVNKDPNSIDVLHRLAPWGSTHWLGTDELGRDLAARLAAGGRATLLIAAGSVALGTAIAIPVGLSAGYSVGFADVVLTRVVDLFIAVPPLLLAIGMVGILGPSQHTTVLALGIAYWPVYARLLRAATKSTLAKPFVDLSRAMGASGRRILVRDVMSSLRPVIMVQTTVMLGFAVLDEASLGFLGLGVQPPHPSWGSILSEARGVILINSNMSLIGGLPILLTVLALNLLSDSVARRLDVKAVR